jgi:hypothetical protein
VLVEGHERAEGRRRQTLGEDGAGRPIPFERPVGDEPLRSLVDQLVEGVLAVRPGLAAAERVQGLREGDQVAGHETGQSTSLPVVLTGPPPGLTNKPVSLFTVTSSPSVISCR